METHFNFDDALFTYMVSTEVNPLFKLHLEIPKCGLYINYTKKTSVLSSFYGSNAIYIIGICIDAYGVLERNNIPLFLLEKSDNDINKLIYESRRLAGKFVIIFTQNNNLFAFNDPIGSLSIFYSTINSNYFSSCDELLRKYLKYDISEKCLNIRKGSGNYHYMPLYNTLSSDIRALIPNHYLDINNKITIRFFPSNKLPIINEDLCKTNIIKSINLIKNIITEYNKYYDIICPLTGGYDSRINIAFVKQLSKKINTYTIKYPNYTDKTFDYKIPIQISESESIEHTLIHPETCPDKYITDIKKIIGDYQSLNLINLTYTLKNNLNDKLILCGHIIGHLGKSTIGYSLPSFAATPRFFINRTGNHSKYIKPQFKKYVKELKNSNLQKHLFDLFALENIIGRWVSQSHMIYSLAGVNILNIYNCREVIENWMCIPRKLRKDRYIHKSILAQLYPSLLNYQFNPDNIFTLVKRNPFLYFLSLPLIHIRNMLRKINEKYFNNIIF